MQSSKAQSETGSPPPPAAQPTVRSCRRKKSEGTSFVADVRDHIHEFIHASMDEHKSCFKNTMQKMFGMTKAAADRTSASQEVESSLLLQTSVSK